ncbi:MAG TPA: hypothetical protein PLO62_07350 [Candidatus Hydrogenedentes bacterium]|nr:hypothetical protein [Candidatus Hydrogenedentota bacterium]HOS03481.1 hypothetical protein [Candidatus Hydrogenedentota bacterium]
MFRSAVLCIVAALLAIPDASFADAHDEQNATAAEKATPSAGPRKRGRKEKPQPAAQEPSPAERSSLDGNTLGWAVRHAGEMSEANIALMMGLQDIRLEKPLNLSRERSAKQIAGAFASVGQCRVQTMPAYAFVYVPGYEQLTDISLTGQLPSKYREITGSIAFGSGMPLYAALAWMGHALNVTLVADNAVGDAQCGEIALAHASVQDALEAMLKSARVVTVTIEATEEYVLLRSPANANPPSALLNADRLDAASKALLDKRIDVYLPQRSKDPARFPLRFAASRLDSVLGTLSEQAAAPITAEKDVQGLPVNPVTLRNVRVATAMDLLVRQWLAPEFGYDAIQGSIHIRRRGAAERIAPAAGTASASTP